MSPSSCEIEESACTTISPSLDLTIRQIKVAEQNYTIVLSYDEVFSDVNKGELFWNYSTLSVEN